MSDASPATSPATFAALGLSDDVVRAARSLGHERPTPIQAAAIPPVLAGRDVIASAATGSGKTAAFVLPLLQRVAGLARRAPGRAPTLVLVLVPTRELAVQVGESARAIARALAGPARLSVSLLHGGVSLNPQLMALRGGADVVVATPGRLLDVVAHNGVSLSDVRCLVLDEADRLLEGGFSDEVDRVLALLHPQRQNLLFSATFPAAVEGLAQRLLMRDPVRVAVDHAPEAPATVDAAMLAERAIEVDPPRRTQLLRHLLQQQAWTRVLVFVATRHACDVVADKLRRGGIAAEAFHGDASQGARTRVLAGFRAGQVRVLVATDLGARGIDIAQLPVVVNYDLPRSADDYVHRIGRTARAGASGLAVSFVSAATEAHFRLIEKRQGRRVPRERVPGFEPTGEAQAGAAPGTGGIKGRRPSRKDKLRAAGAAGTGSGEA